MISSLISAGDCEASDLAKRLAIRTIASAGA